MAKPKISVWDRNFAEDARIRDQVKSLLLPILKNKRDARLEIQLDWEKYFNMWNVRHDGYHTYSGMARLYIPEVRKAVEAQTRQLLDDAFPNDDFFDCVPGPLGTRKGAETWKSIHRYNIDRSQLRVKMHPFFRQQVLYGTSPAKISWCDRKNKIFSSLLNPKNKKLGSERRFANEYVGPDFESRDLMLWYTLNPLKPNLDDGCFEDQFVSEADIRRIDKQMSLAELDKILAGKTDATQQDEMRQYIDRVERMGIVIRSQDSFAGEARIAQTSNESGASSRMMMTEVYMNLVLPEACEEGEDPELPIQMKILIFNNQNVGQIIRNPYWFQKPPYIVGKYILPGPGEYYGQGLTRAIEYMQQELNSKAEQAMDATTLALNPLAFIDPALASQVSDFEVAPGAIWFVRPDGVKLGSIPDISASGYQAISQIRGQMMDYSDRTPALPPQLQGKARSATQADIIERSISVDQRCFQIQNEVMVLTPLLEMWERLFDQNADDEQVILVLGQNSRNYKRKIIKKGDLIGDYNYFWKVASYVSQKPVMARQMLDAVKVLSILPPDQMAKINFQADQFFKILWKEMWSLPDADRVFGSPEEMVSQDPEIEHTMLEMGTEIEVLPADQDDQHLAAHALYAQNMKDEYLKQKLVLHMMLHEKQKERKILLMQQLQRQQQMQQMMMAQQAQSQDQRRGNSGNRTQMSPNATTGNMGSGVRA